VIMADRRQQLTEPLLDDDLESNLRERNENIQGISNDLSQLREAMGDLNALLIEQRQPLEDSQHNVESGSVYVTEATKELKKAQRYQSSARRRLCVLIAIVLIILTVVVLVGLKVAKVL